ncbi:DUF4149 domain-containing protein [Pelotalea chapellei]|uniref:DUF4149 domain-containing protein n=1 Tax=Pelotalea chapellei TaxID=44671 RepID=A0ABS5U6X6_9BACT|nr:DUF4149 domain-containing protein [Pelotalea chapellei]MBT1071417.1 DUF4149 domain-containing protein [Pelotalea chapellei]
MQIAATVYRLAVACWLGGVALFTTTLTPTLFKSYSRDIAGGIVGVLFPGYFRWGMACGAVALVTLAISRGRHSIASAIIISAMLLITAAQAFIIEPRAVEIKKEIPSFETTSKDHPARVQFRKLHAVSAVANLVVLGGGITLVILF